MGRKKRTENICYLCTGEPSFDSEMAMDKHNSTVHRKIKSKDTCVQCRICGCISPNISESVSHQARHRKNVDKIKSLRNSSQELKEDYEGRMLPSMKMQRKKKGDEKPLMVKEQTCGSISPNISESVSHQARHRKNVDKIKSLRNSSQELKEDYEGRVLPSMKMQRKKKVDEKPSKKRWLCVVTATAALLVVLLVVSFCLS